MTAQDCISLSYRTEFFFGVGWGACDLTPTGQCRQQWTVTVALKNKLPILLQYAAENPYAFWCSRKLPKLLIYITNLGLHPIHGGLSTWNESTSETSLWSVQPYLYSLQLCSTHRPFYMRQHIIRNSDTPIHSRHAILPKSTGSECTKKPGLDWVDNFTTVNGKRHVMSEF